MINFIEQLQIETSNKQWLLNNMAEVLLPVLGDWIKWSKIICYENKIFASNRKSEIKQQYYLQQNLDSNKTKNLMEKYKTTKKKREEKQAPYFKNLKSYLKRQYKDYNFFLLHYINSMMIYHARCLEAWSNFDTFVHNVEKEENTRIQIDKILEQLNEHIKVKIEDEDIEQ